MAVPVFAVGRLTVKVPLSNGLSDAEASVAVIVIFGLELGVIVLKY